MKEETRRICLLWLAAHIALRANAASQSTQPAGRQQSLSPRVRATLRQTNALAGSNRISPASKDVAVV